MKNNKGLTLVSLVVTIIVLLILAGVSLSVLLGENGVLKRATTVEETFNKSEVLEELNILITEKYLAAYNKAASQPGDVNQNIKKFYSGEKVIWFLKGYTGGDTGEEFSGEPDSKVIIEDLAGVDNATAAEKCYFIKIDSLNRSISKYGTGKNEDGAKDLFYIKGAGESYKVYYRDADDTTEDEEVGVLQIQQTL